MRTPTWESQIGSYVSYRDGHPHVRMEQTRYLEMKAYLSQMAIHHTGAWIEQEFGRQVLEPYAPIRSQFFSILRAVNRRRKAAGYEIVPSNCIRVRRHVISPFEKSTKPADAENAA